jgi:hypothetical protein
MLIAAVTGEKIGKQNKEEEEEEISGWLACKCSEEDEAEDERK